MDLRKVKPSKNFEDHVSDEWRNSQDWNYILGMQALQDAGIDPEEALKGLTPQQVNDILFHRAFNDQPPSPLDRIPAPPPYAPGTTTSDINYDWLKRKKK